MAKEAEQMSSFQIMKVPTCRSHWSGLKKKKKKSCTTMFFAGLFTIARTWKQPKCPLTVEWIKKMWHTYKVEYYSAIKRNEIELFVVRWMDLESVIQSEVSQKEKNKYRMLTYIYGILKKNGSDEPRGRTGIKTQM